MTILSIIVNIVYYLVMNTAIYIDRAKMANGEVREWHRSPVDRLNMADKGILYYLQLILAIISIITSVLLLSGISSSIVKKIQLITTIGSTVVFLIIMIVTASINVKYS